MSKKHKQPVSPGVALIADERARQMNEWGNAHDDNHGDDALAFAAACYATPAAYRAPTLNNVGRPTLWPWETCWWKPTPKDRVRELVKAGALIAAEIDRLQRAASSSTGNEGRG